jgi:NADH-quinone oxidoreductase subunit M
LETPGVHSFDWAILKNAHHTMSATEQSLVFWAFFLAFAIKMPIFPFHTWQPDTYTNAPTQGTMLLSGIMLKMGVFGAMYWLVPMVPMGVAQWQPLVMVLCIIGIVYGSIIAIQQRDAKRLAAYSSFAHVGLIAAGVFAHTYSGLQGATMQMLAHGFNVVALFYIIDLIEAKTGKRNLDELGGIATNNRLFATLAFIIVLGSIAMPLTNAFVGEFMLLLGVYQYSLWAAVIAGTTIILGAVYMLKFYKKAFFGETNANTENIHFMDDSTAFVLIPLAAIVIIMGVCPKPFMDLAQPAIMELLK